MPKRTITVMLGLAAMTAACSIDDPNATSAASSAASTTTATTAPPPTVSAVARPGSPCERTGTEVMGVVATPDLVEASGLVASRAHPGVLWSHNDGGAEPGVFGIGFDGSDLGFHALQVDAVDIEDIAIATGPANTGAGSNSDVLYLADIGDNGERRASVSVFRFAEPDPSAPGPIEAVERLEFTYPSGPHNAETLLIDERNDRLVIVTKEQARDGDGEPNPFGRTETSFVFEASLDAPSPSELTPAGVVDTQRLEQLATHPNLHPATIVGFGGVVTGGDVSADGSLVALRTYEAVWVWTRRSEQTVSEVFADEPCQVAAITELQGEAVAFVDDELVTTGEGENQPINRLGR